MGEITGLTWALTNGRAANCPGPPAAISSISTIGSTCSASVKDVATGLVVFRSSAWTVFTSRSKLSGTSVATQQRVNQLTFSSVSCSLVKSCRSCSVEGRYRPLSRSSVCTAAPPVPKCTASPPTVMLRAGSRPCRGRPSAFFDGFQHQRAGQQEAVPVVPLRPAGEEVAARLSGTSPCRAFPAAAARFQKLPSDPLR